MNNKPKIMSYENLSAQIEPKTLENSLTQVNEIKKSFSFLINLTPEDRMRIPKMGPKTVNFVEKSLELAEQNPELVPPYVKINELKEDLKLSKDLGRLRLKLKSLYEAIEDTEMAAGSESYSMALTFYNSLKAASKMNVPGTTELYNELKERFETNRKTEKAEQNSL